MLSVVRRHRLHVVDMQFVVHSPSPFPGGAFAWEARCLMSVDRNLELPCRSLLFNAESDFSVAVSDFGLLGDCQAVCRLCSGSLDATASSPSQDLLPRHCRVPAHNLGWDVSATFTDFGVRKDCRSGSMDLRPEVGGDLARPTTAIASECTFSTISSVATPAVPPDQGARIITP